MPYLSSRLPFSLLLTQWSSVLNPFLANPLNQIQVIEASLINGVTVINHKLQAVQQGWIILDQDAAASIYRSAPFNTLTLALTSNAAVNVKLGVF